MKLKRVSETTIEATGADLEAQAESLLASVGSSRDDGLVLVVQREGTVLGVCVVRLTRDAELLALVTEPNHRQRGVGRRLLAEAVRRARAAGSRRLRVRLPTTFDAAATFFRHLGFEETHLALDLSL